MCVGGKEGVCRVSLEGARAERRVLVGRCACRRWQSWWPAQVCTDECPVALRGHQQTALEGLELDKFMGGGEGHR